ncbi:MAG: methylated-DNA--[protein]-cysteine S-methyltransferase [Oscillospiraceae bacterium]|nr:methylated-DNA--[protein]-cysteine S-methyltransferase [Oscillospiraceae bacterium]
MFHYKSPLGNMTMASDGYALTGLWFDGQKYYGLTLSGAQNEKNLPVFRQTENWLNLYFEGMQPDFIPELALQGSSFRQIVWGLLLAIPYGQTVTYGELASAAAEKLGYNSMSAQAVGGAVGHNPVSVIVPCHRVIGADGSLTGYAGGIERKKALLEIEQWGKGSFPHNRK